MNAASRRDLPGLDDLWVDGVLHRVPTAVVAHVRFPEALNANIAESATKNARKATDLERELRQVSRWTPLAKMKVIARVQAHPEQTEAVLAEYEISREELAGWINQFERHGEPGLMGTKLQKLRARVTS